MRSASARCCTSRPTTRRRVRPGQRPARGLGVDLPSWAAALGSFGFTLLTAAELLSSLEDADTSALSKAEWRQIKHWQPATLGAAIFNSWD